MTSAMHCVPSPYSQLIAEEFGGHDPFADLDWTEEELDVNLRTDEAPEGLDVKASKLPLIDEMLEKMDQLEDLNELELDADVLCQSPWMDYTNLRSTPTTDANFAPDAAVYNALNNGAFTPPQTPPYEHQQLQQVPASFYELSSPATTDSQSPTTPNQPDLSYLLQIDIADYVQPTDVAAELAVVDELVRKHADNFVPTSPSCSSPTFSSDSSSDDCEWYASEGKKAAKPARRRAKPYSGTEDKRSRKKEQNKNAATRYRMKKKAEVAEIQSEENALEAKKAGLEGQVGDLEREIKVLKGLMRDFFKEKGLVR